jgi:hypothetical protein
MKYKSPLFSQASGSIGGTTFSHNRGGMYVRSRATPTDPGSARQQTLRAAMGSLAPYWGETLTADQRNAWRDYAANTAFVNVLGDTVYLTGQQQFLRANVPRLQASLAILADAPTTFDYGTFSAPNISSALDDDSIDVAFTNTDDWATDDAGALLAYGGKQQGPGRDFYKGPWRYMGILAGDSITPPTSPESFTSQFGLDAGNRVWVLVRIIQPDGRLSLPIVLGPELIAAAP